MRRVIIGLAFSLLVWIMLGPTGVRLSSAQEQGGWSHPFQISTAGRVSSEGHPVADSYGFVHLLWEETKVEDSSSVILYSRFDGVSWSVPLDLHVTDPFIEIVGLSTYVDSEQNLHLIWTQGFGVSTQLYYRKAPAFHANDYSAWTKPVRGRLSANNVRLIVDDEGTLHLLYSKIANQEPGVYYSKSKDEGYTWSDSKWLDPDIPPNRIPNALEFAMDDSAGFHASWFYSATDGTEPNWVRYSHSLDGSENWSPPVTIARIEEDDEVNTLSSASPVLAVQGENVHIVFAGGEFHKRNHAFSSDRGITWNKPVRIFGNLEGQAFEDLIVDNIGRVHYFGQIRYPTAIYHSYWENGAWSPIKIIYMIRADESDTAGDRIQAHHTYPAFRAGNQVVLTFADPPPFEGRRLFSMVGTLEEVLPLTPLPEPTPIATSLITSDQVQQIQSTPTPPLQLSREVAEPGSPNRIILAGIISPILLLATMFLIRRNRHRFS